ncbi:MAG TPA: hypothetical protein VMN81_02480 [Vicinamibacterales bacterium]|nr:hypothetical protein [Vicinamibacterales bacterium]
MMTKKTIVFSALALLVTSSAALAQSPLAEAARREAERRKAVRAAPTTYTNEDLARLPVRSAPARPALPPTTVTTIGPAGSAAAPPAAAEAPAGAAEAAGPRDEKYWRDRMTAARTSLSRLEMFAEALQSRINALSADFVNRDDPAQRQKIAEDRQRALDELDRVARETKEAAEAITAIQEEARRLGVPPGWVR